MAIRIETPPSPGIVEYLTQHQKNYSILENSKISIQTNPIGRIEKYRVDIYYPETNQARTFFAFSEEQIIETLERLSNG